MEGRSSNDAESVGPESAEEAVRDFRRCLREEKRLRERGDGRGAGEARRRADERYEAIAERLAGRFRRHAKGAFGGGLPHLIVEAQDEMNTLLCSDLMDLESKNELYEKRFDLCVKRMMQDAVKLVRVQFDMPANGEIRLWDYVPESLQRSGDGSDNEEPNMQPPDDSTEAAFEQALKNEEVRRLLDRIPEDNQRLAFTLKALGFTWPEVARAVGVSESTAKRYCIRALEVLARVTHRQN
jgi:hypothetical protein